MKRNLTVLVFAILAASIGSMLFIGCKKTSKYSCNPQVENYAASFKSENQDITRDELVQLEPEIQMAVFRSLSPENKLRIYREKINLVLERVAELTQEERAALINLRDNCPIEAYDMENHDFIVEWESSVRNNLGWSDTPINAYVSTWTTPTEMAAALPSGGGDEQDCTCRSFWGCSGLADCDWGDCTVTNGGCGIIGTSNCKGLCLTDVSPSNGAAVIQSLPDKYVF